MTRSERLSMVVCADNLSADDIDAALDETLHLHTSLCDSLDVLLAALPRPDAYTTNLRYYGAVAEHDSMIRRMREVIEEVQVIFDDLIRQRETLRIKEQD